MEGDDPRSVDHPTPDDCERGLAEARDLAQRIVGGEGDALRLADAIYWAGYLHGGFADEPGGPACQELGDVAGEFVQLTASVHISKNYSEATRKAALRIREVAEAFLEGRPFRGDHEAR
ncbi:MAG TPA: hypothetical protein VGG31_02375 [Candidatus Dormibacteraeota bacterium]